jgi:TP901 family phage tail tape measure protein
MKITLMASKEEIRRVSIFINGSEAELQLGQIERGSAKLKNELARLVPGTEAFKAKMLELRQTRQVLSDIKDDINGVGGAFGWLKTEVGKLGALATGFLGLQFITQEFQDIISQNAKFSDSISDIQKTTGMSELAVRRLQSSFKEIDTRSSRAELNSLAEVAGKLGITGEKDVLGFVRAADQINVALGKDLGNAEQAINDLGKLTEIFHIKDEYGLEDALLKTGSAINFLGAAGTANEGYIVEFTKRMGGIAPAAKMSIQDVMALGTVMDELGQPVEAAATSIGQFVVGMGKDTAKFASIAGMTKKAFEDLLSKDGTAALKAVLGNIQSSGQGIQGLADSMGLVGEDGARATAALGLLSNNLELLNTRQAESNKAFKEGTSLTQEYNIKNSNFAATLERLSKKFNALTSNSSLTDFLTSAVNGLDSFVTGLNKCMGFITGMMKLLGLGGAAWLSYSIYVGLANSQTLAFLVNLVRGETVMAMSRATTIALAGAKALLSGNLAKASQAMRLFTVATEANPIGALVAAVMTAAAAFYLYNDSVSDATKINNRIIDINAEAEKSYHKEKTAIEAAQNTLKTRNATKEQEANAIAKLRDLMPDHLKGYSDEEIAAGKATEAINKQIDAIMRKARAAAASKRLEDLEGDNIDILAKNRKGWDGLSFTDKAKARLTMPTMRGAFSGSSMKDAYYKGLQQQAEANNKEKAEILQAFGGDINYSESPRVNLTAPKSNTTFNLKDATKDQLDQQLEKDKKAIDQLKRGTEEYNKTASEMVAIRKRLKEIAKDTGEGGNGPDLAKRAAAAYKALQAQVKTLDDKAIEDSMSKNALELKNASDKYDALIAKEKDFLKTSGTTADQRLQTQKNINNLIAQKGEDLKNIRIRQEQEVGQKIKELRNALSNVYETELQKETNRINNFYDDLANKAATDDDWLDIEEARSKDLADAKIRDEKRFQEAVTEIKQQGEVASANADQVELARINKKYDDQIEALKKKFGLETTLTQEQQDAIDLINKNRKAETAKLDEDTSKKNMQFAVETAQKLSNAAFEMMSSSRQAEADAQVKTLEDQKDKELANKNLTEDQKAAIEDRYAKQEAALKLKAWEADKQAAEEQAIINGALAVGKALAQVGPLGAFVIPGIIAETAAQVAIIAARKPPAFEDGGYSAVDYKKPQGWVSSPTLFKNSASGRSFTAGEKYKTEYIVSSEQLKDPVVRDMVGAMEANRGVRRFEAGGYSNATAKLTVPNTTSTSTTVVQVDNSELVKEMRLTREAFKNVKVTQDYRAVKELDEKMAQIRTKANG